MIKKWFKYKNRLIAISNYYGNKSNLAIYNDDGYLIDISNEYYDFHYKNDNPYVLAITNNGNHVILKYDEKQNKYKKITKVISADLEQLNRMFVDQKSNVVITNNEIYFSSNDKLIKKPIQLTYKHMGTYDIDGSVYYPDKHAIYTDNGKYVLLFTKDGNIIKLNTKNGNIEMIQHIDISKNRLDIINTGHENIFLITHGNNDKLYVFNSNNGNIKQILTSDTMLVNRSCNETPAFPIIETKDKYYVLKSNGTLIEVHDKNDKKYENKLLKRIFTIDNGNVVIKHVVSGDNYDESEYSIHIVDGNTIKPLVRGDFYYGMLKYSSNSNIFTGYNRDSLYTIFMVDRKNKTVKSLFNSKSKNSILCKCDGFVNRKTNYFAYVDKNRLYRIFFYDESNEKITEIPINKKNIYNLKIIPTNNKDISILLYYYQNDNNFKYNMFLLNNKDIIHLQDAKIKIKSSFDLFKTIDEINGKLLVTNHMIVLDYNTNNPEILWYTTNDKARINNIDKGSEYLIISTNKESIIFPNYKTTNKSMKKHIILNSQVTHLRDNYFVDNDNNLITIDPEKLKTKLIGKIPKYNNNISVVKANYSDYLFVDNYIIHLPTKTKIKYNVSKNKTLPLLVINNNMVSLTKEPLDQVIKNITTNVVQMIC